MVIMYWSHSKFTRVLLLGVLGASLSVGCQPDSPNPPRSRELDETVGAAVLQPQGKGKVLVKFAGLTQDQRASLYRVDANRLSKVQQLSGRSGPLQMLELDSGFYMLELDGSAAKFPVPAIAPLAKEMSVIGLQPFPAVEDSWCWIPRGPAVVGDTIGVGREDERPAKIVDVDGFFLARHEVTNDQYAEFLSAVAGSETFALEDWIDLESRKCRIAKVADKQNAYLSDAPTLPVVMVSLAGARAYCQWLNEDSKFTYRLPRETEWEKAARGPESYVYSYGNVYQQSAANGESGKLKPVGSYRANSWGLYDMTGNVFEWMENVADPRKHDTTLNHSLRGGSFMLDGMYLRNSLRMKQSPSVMTDDIGFRVLREASNTDRQKAKP